jgi:hypothetical protein
MHGLSIGLIIIAQQLQLLAPILSYKYTSVLVPPIHQVTAMPHYMRNFWHVKPKFLRRPPMFQRVPLNPKAVLPNERIFG